MGKTATPPPAAASAVEKLHEGKKTKKGKKKGRPSLLDIQKRYLRLQRQHELELERRQQQRRRGQRKSPSPNPSNNPYPRPSPARRSSLRSPDSDSAAVDGSRGDSGDGDDDVEDEEEEEEGETRVGRRRQRKLRLVLRLSPNGRRDGELGASSSGSEGDSRAAVKKRRVEAVGGSAESETGKQRSALKMTHDSRQGEPQPPGLEGGTPLPDEQLLVFILDRLQKKDIYGVFSEPVDPDELPDYHDVIEFPMDFSTVRKKLSRRAYANLEEFEEDVFLISSNAMRYNAPDTIYFRQARAIQELAKKDFDNLRQDSDDSELESKPVRTSRLFGKDVHSKAASRPLAEHGVFNDSVGPIPTSNDHQSTLITDALSKVMDSDKRATIELSGRAFQKPSNGINHSKLDYHKPNRNDESSGFWMKEQSMRYCKKITISEENRRNTDKQTPATVCAFQPSFLTTFDEEKKELVTVGVHVENAYARSLARFSAKFGSVGWEIAVKLIKRSLPPGIKFGRGWVGEKDAPQQNRLPIPSKFSLAKSLTLSYGPCEAKRPTGKLEGSLSLIAVDKSCTGHDLHLSSATTIVTTEHPNKVEAGIVFKPTQENVLVTDTAVQSSNLVSRPNRGIQPADNGHAETTTRSFGPTSNMAETPENSAMPNMVFEGKNNSMHPVDAGRADETVTNSAYFSSCTTKASKLNQEKPNPGGPPTAANSASNFLHSKAMMHMDPEMTRANYSRTRHSMSNLIRQSSSHHLDTGSTNSPKPCATNSVDNFIHPAVIDSLATEKAKINNQPEVNHGNGFFSSLRAGRLEEAAASMGNANTTSGDDLLQPTGKLHFESDLAKLGMLGSMNSRRLSNLAAVGTPFGERTAAGDVAYSGGTVESDKDFARPLQGPSWSQNAQSFPPDLNIRFQLPSSPTTVMVDVQQPDLALQL